MGKGRSSGIVKATRAHKGWVALIDSACVRLSLCCSTKRAASPAAVKVEGRPGGEVAGRKRRACEVGLEASRPHLPATTGATRAKRLSNSEQKTFLSRSRSQQVAKGQYVVFPPVLSLLLAALVWAMLAVVA